MKPLLGMRVLDFSKVLAGPLCTQSLSDYGADVIKIEACDAGDDTRGWPPFRNGDGAVFLSANRNKRSLGLDLKSAEGRAIAHRLAQSADIVVESFGPGVPERLGIDYATLSAINPHLIYCSISGFGRSGPLAKGKGYDMILQAFSGMVSIMGEPDSGPVRAPYSPVDQGTGMHALSAILAAVIERGRSGKGCQIEVSLFETGVAYLGYMIQAYWERGTQPQRFGCAHESLCPYQAFEASDGMVLIGIASEPLWRQFCKLAGLDAYVDDPRFKTNGERVKHRTETVALVQSVIATRPSAEWVDLMVEAGIPACKINSFADMLEHPHTRASGIVAEYESEAYGHLQAIGMPVKFDGQRSQGLNPPPTLGQHTGAILAELGYGREEIEQMCANGNVHRSALEAQ